jgi:hypothetical protein
MEGMGARPRDIDHDVRVLQVAKWILHPYPRHRIISLAVTKWMVTPSTTMTYITEAREIVREAFAGELEDHKSLIIKKYWDVYHEAMKDRVVGVDKGGEAIIKKDLMSATRVLAGLSNIMGLVSTKNGNAVININRPLQDIPEAVLIEYASKNN